MRSEKRVVVTGLGAITCVGNNVAESWNSVLSGTSGIAAVTKFDTSGFRTRIGGEVRNFDITDHVSIKEARRMDPFCHYALAAADEAIHDAELDLGSEDLSRIGVIIGSGIGGINSLESQIRRLVDLGPSRISPFLIPMMIGDMASGIVSIRYGLKGPNFSIASACATGTHAIGEAYWMIMRDDADVMISGGSEASVTPISFAGFSAMKALSERNDEPAKASRPFDAGRDGFVLAEGAGVVVLEDLRHALNRDAEIVAEIIGYRANADAYHITAPDPENTGAVTGLKTLLERSGVGAGEVDYINAHGTGTVKNDQNETQAIKKVFGDHAHQIPVTSTKSLTGHALGAAGAIETIFTSLAIQESTIPGTYNYENPDPECDLNYVPNMSLKKSVRIALNVNFGFGGHNAIIALKNYEM